MISLFTLIKGILPDSREYPFKGVCKSKKISDYRSLHMFAGQQYKKISRANDEMHGSLSD